MCLCVFKSLQVLGFARLSGTEHEFSQGHNSTGSEREGGEKRMVGSGGFCWRGKRETRLRKSENSVREVLHSETKNTVMCWIQKSLFPVRK